MSSAIDSIALASQFLDRRVKLLDCQKEQVKRLFDNGNGETIAQLAIRFRVNRRLIDFVLFPEKLEKNKATKAARGGWKTYYKKDVGTQAARDYRTHKKEALKHIVKTKSAHT